MKLTCSLFLLLFSLTSNAQEDINLLDYSNSERLSETSEEEQVSYSEVKIYPNPAYGSIVNISTRYQDIKEIVIYDVFGEVVLRDKITSSSLNISKLARGVYVLQVTEKNKTLTRKLVVK